MSLVHSYPAPSVAEVTVMSAGWRMVQVMLYARSWLVCTVSENWTTTTPDKVSPCWQRGTLVG